MDAINIFKQEIDRFDVTHRPRLFAYFESVQKTHLLSHAFRKLVGFTLGNINHLERTPPICSEIQSESESEISPHDLGIGDIIIFKRHCKGL